MEDLFLIDPDLCDLDDPGYAVSEGCDPDEAYFDLGSARGVLTLARIRVLHALSRCDGSGTRALSRQILGDDGPTGVSRIRSCLNTLNRVGLVEQRLAFDENDPNPVAEWYVTDEGRLALAECVRTGILR